MKKERKEPEVRLCETCLHYFISSKRSCQAFDVIPTKYWKQNFEDEPLHTKVDKNQIIPVVYEFNGFYPE